MTEKKDDQNSGPGESEESPDRETVRDWIKEDLMDLLPDMLQSLKGQPNENQKTEDKKDDQDSLHRLSAKELEEAFYGATKKAMAELREEDKGRRPKQEEVKTSTKKKEEGEKDSPMVPPKKKKFNFWGDS